MGNDSKLGSGSVGQEYGPADWIAAATQFGYPPDITPGDIRYWDGGVKLAEVHQRARELKSHRDITDRANLLAVAADICAILDWQCAHDGETLVYDDYHTIGEQVARLHEKLTAALTTQEKPS